MRLRSFRILLCAAVLVLLPVVAIPQWSEHYERGLEEMERGEWSKAANSFLAALRSKDRPELRAREYGLHFSDYFPYYQLGRALFFQLDFAGAMARFDQELSYGVITKSEFHQELLRFRETAKALQEQLATQTRLAGSEKAKEAWIELLKESHRRMQGKRGRDLDSLLSEMELDEEARKQISQWLARLLITAPVSPPLSRSAGQTPATTDSVNLLRNAAVAAYLQGRYREALEMFNRLARLVPDEPMLADWQQRSRFELSRLDQADAPLNKTDTVTIVQSAAPLIVIRKPDEEVSRCRTQKAHLIGLANDDVGIAAVEFVINGKTLPLADGSTRLHPARSADGSFPFERDIPLKLGENEITVIAYDLDMPQHSRTAFRRIIRQPPLHQTTAFWLVAGSGLLVVLGAVAGNRIIKYRIAFVHRYNPYIAGAPIRNKEMFFGRQQLLDRILRTLPNNSLMMYGPRRIGKTSLQYQLQRLLRESQDPEYHFVPVFIDLQGIAEEIFFAHLIEEVREQLGHEVAATVPAPTDRQKYGHREFANDLRTIINMLQKSLANKGKTDSHKKVRLVFLIDEVDELNRYGERTNQMLRAIFMKTFSENLVAVLTGGNIRKEWESESSPWYNFFEQIPMPALTQEEAMQLIHEPVAGFFKFEPEAANKIWEASQGKPFVIQKFCVRLVNLAIEKRHRKIVATDVDAIRNEVLQDTAGKTQQMTAIFDHE